MVGVANYEHKAVSAVNTAAGGIAGTITSSSIIRCKVGIDLYFKRGACSAWSSTSASEGSDIGGIVGTIGGTCTIKYCSFIGGIKCLLPESLGPQAIWIGGIVGSANNSSPIECCEVISSAIQLKDYGKSSMYRNICGIGCYSSPKSCRCVIDKIIIMNDNNPIENVNEVIYRVSGICNESSAINCYSSISNVEFNSKQPKTNIYMSGISYARSVDEPVACFSNSDMIINSNVNVQKSSGSGNSLCTCFDGATSFNSEQMQTSEFLKALNTYPTMEMDGPIWCIGSEGYPYIGELYSTKIANVKADMPSTSKIYDLQGKQLKSYRKGINIIGGRKVIVK